MATAARVSSGGAVDFFDEAELEQSLDGAIERPGAEPHAIGGLLGDLAHDCVTMEVFACEREQDLEGGGGERVEGALGHVPNSMIDISINDCISQKQERRQGEF